MSVTIETLYKDNQTEINRVQRSDEVFILKRLHSQNPQKDNELIAHEYDVLKNLTSPHVIKAVAKDNCSLILENFQGHSLNHIFGEIQDIQPLLEIAIDLAEGLGEIHHENVIHKDIKPHNILIDPISHQVKYIDFGLSTRLSREVQQVLNPTQIEGTLHYISPEQTGRINRPLDYRSDIYSLGVTLYQLFTNKLPFEAPTQQDLIHMHIAMKPIPPHVILPSVPEMISRIIIKCLAKDAEERYQSAFGLKMDFEKCLSQLKSGNAIEFFVNGENDVHDHFQLPVKLYGRNEEIKMLLDLFQKASEGSLQVLFVKGYAGIGKTSLVNELQKPVAQKKGFFISSKFDQFQQKSASSGLIGIIKGLMEQVYLFSQEELLIWKEKIKGSLN